MHVFSHSNLAPQNTETLNMSLINVNTDMSKCSKKSQLTFFKFVYFIYFLNNKTLKIGLCET